MRALTFVVVAALAAVLAPARADVVFHYEGGACGPAIRFDGSESTPAGVLVDGKGGVPLWDDCNASNGPEGGAMLPSLEGDRAAAGPSSALGWDTGISASFSAHVRGALARIDRFGGAGSRELGMDASGKIAKWPLLATSEVSDDGALTSRCALELGAGDLLDRARAVPEPSTMLVVVTGLSATLPLKPTYKPRLARAAA